MADYIIDIVQPGQRLAILLGLRDAPGGRLNEHDLLRWLDLMAYRPTRDQVRDRLRDLRALDAVRVDMAGEIMIATLTARGEDHIERRGTPLQAVALPPRD